MNRSLSPLLMMVLSTLTLLDCSSSQSPSACPAGAERCACYGNGTCNPSVECRSQVCVASAGAGGSGANANGGQSGSSTGGSATTGGTSGGLGGALAMGGSPSGAGGHSGGAVSGAGGSSGGASGAAGGTACGDTATDPNNCGRCGHVCQASRRRAASQRAMPTAQASVRPAFRTNAAAQRRSVGRRTSGRSA
jgi:hypothetical protein